jgi:hypothetical protein
MELVGKLSVPHSDRNWRQVEFPLACEVRNIGVTGEDLNSKQIPRRPTQCDTVSDITEDGKAVWNITTLTPRLLRQFYWVHTVGGKKTGKTNWNRLSVI